jgi:perosamine synthetase
LVDTTSSGAPERIPLCVPELTGNEWSYLKECLDSGWVSSVGPWVDRFEERFAELIGVPYAVATASGTAAIHLALLVAGVQPDDEVLVSDLTFIAPANVVRYVGAWPVFIDVEPDYWQMDPAKAATFLEEGCSWDGNELRNRTTGRRVRAILPVHILGHPADMDRLLELARRYGLVVVEDATESLGASYRGKPVGTSGQVGCFSFNGNKLITTGGGGMLVTADFEQARHARHLATQAKADPIEYIHREIGFNYRLTSVQAGLGLAQLDRFDDFLAAKRAIASRYAAELVEVPGVTLMAEAPWASSAWWMYTVLIDPAEYGQTSRELLERLAAERIETRPLWQPLHLSAAHSDAQPTTGPVSERLWQQSISLPSSVGLTAAEQTRVIAALTSAER